MVRWLCSCNNGVVVMYLYKLCGGYVLVAMVWWLCSCSNGVVVMCTMVLSVAMVLVMYLLCSNGVALCTFSNGVVVMSL